MVRSRWRWRRTFRTGRRRRRSRAFGRRSRSALGRARQHSTVSQAESECESNECRNHLESMKLVKCDDDDDERDDGKGTPWNQAIYIVHNLPGMEVKPLSLGRRICV
jgi:hypothetical protein